MNSVQHSPELPATRPNPDGEVQPYRAVMTEEELIRFLRIPEISSATNHRHVIENLKRNHGLPRVHLCGKTVYPIDSVRQWLQQRVTCGRRRPRLVQWAWTNPSPWPASERRCVL